MTKVDLAKKEIGVLQKEIKRWEEVKKRVEWDISLFESHIGELKESQRNAWTEIENKNKELEQLKLKLEKIKVEVEPMDGQLTYVNTGYKAIVVV